MKSGIQVRDKIGRVFSAISALNDLASRDVLVGIPEENDARFTPQDIEAEKQRLKADGKKASFAAAVASLTGHAEQPINNAALGYIHENGSPTQNIPARPALVPGVQEALPEVKERFAKAAKAAAQGDRAGMERQLHAAGLIAVNKVRALINSGIPPALSESTIAARLRRGRKGTKPLIDTGQLRNAYTYVIRKK